jgi:hypothetical protein
MAYSAGVLRSPLHSENQSQSLTSARAGRVTPVYTRMGAIASEHNAPLCVVTRGGVSYRAFHTR